MHANFARMGRLQEFVIPNPELAKGRNLLLARVKRKQIPHSVRNDNSKTESTPEENDKSGNDKSGKDIGLCSISVSQRASAANSFRVNSRPFAAHLSREPYSSKLCCYENHSSPFVVLLLLVSCVSGLRTEREQCQVRRHH